MTTYYRLPTILPSVLHADKIAVFYRNFVWHFSSRTVAMQFAVEAITLDSALPARISELTWYSGMCSLARMCESDQPIGAPDSDRPMTIQGL